MATVFQVANNMRVMIAFTLAWTAGQACQAQTPKSRVIPILEIEVLDPNRDSRGNPAIETLHDGLGHTQVEIPPALIVHRYYYTGDRTFRGPDLPGGPCILVFHHPKSGEKTYLPVQMLPGSPQITYTARSIVYDYGDRATIVSFPRVGVPIVSYRNGQSIQDRVENSLKLDKLKSVWSRSSESIEMAGSKASNLGTGLIQGSKEAFRPITLPVQNLSRMIPGAAALADPSLSAKIAEEKALSDREREIQKAKCLNDGRDIDIPRR